MSQRHTSSSLQHHQLVGFDFRFPDFASNLFFVVSKIDNISSEIVIDSIIDNISGENNLMGFCIILGFLDYWIPRIPWIPRNPWIPWNIKFSSWRSGVLEIWRSRVLEIRKSKVF